MPQVAQQDYIKDVTIADVADLTPAEKKMLWDLVERGTIWDVIITISAWKTRVIAVAEDDYFVTIAYNPATGELAELDCRPEE